VNNNRACPSYKSQLEPELELFLSFELKNYDRALQGILGHNLPTRPGKLRDPQMACPISPSFTAIPLRVEDQVFG
jgi:hypothetical protein